jgi:DNA-binding CsgD family transcriptional regulator
MTLIAPNPKWGAVEGLLDAALKSETITDFCKSLVHSGFTGEDTQGCQLFGLNDDSELHVVSGYGIKGFDEDTVISVWDENPVAEAIRSKEFVFSSAIDAGKAIVAIPLLDNQIPVGCLCLVMHEKTNELPFDEGLVALLSKLGAFNLTQLSSTSQRRASTSNTETPEDLTSRQLQILSMMADGLVNVEIARELLLSESTIRQETVRIYRALRVPNRTEAAKKGKALGLIRTRNLQSSPPAI